MQKKLPIGIQSFSRMIEGDFIYVDKTKYIKSIIDQGDCFFLSRPRRFGKSLLLSTFKEIFSGNEKLFEGLYITQTNYVWAKHPVFLMSFTINVESADNLVKDIEWRLMDCAQQHGIDISDAPSIQTKLIALIQRLAMHNRVVILIDEYDYPLINNIHNIAVADECRKVMHDFFIVLKELGDYIRFIFITGVTKFARTSIFSGLNNLDDLSLLPIAAPLLGYNHQELITYFGANFEAIATKQKRSLDDLLSEIRTWYNGYQFVEIDSPEQEALVKIYNPFSILLYLSRAKILNYWADTGTPFFLAHLIRTEKFPVSDIDCSEVNYEETKSYDIDKIKLIPLLWQTGYLTIDSYDPKTQNYKLTYPNQEVKVSFLNYFLSQLTDTPIAIIKNYTTEFEEAIQKEDLNAFFKTFEIFLANLPYTMQLSEEPYYQTSLYIIFKLIGANVSAEEVTQDGRIDAVLEGPKSIFLFEIKLNKSAQKAIQQIEKKRYYTKYLGSNKKIVLVGVSFNTKKRNIQEWISIEKKLDLC